MDAETPPSAPPAYADEDLVYVDTDLRVVVGKVEWTPSGKPKPLEIPETPQEPGDTKQRGRMPRRKRFYPWGTYRSMKHVYKLEGKQPKQDGQHTLDEAIALAMQHPFWD